MQGTAFSESRAWNTPWSLMSEGDSLACGGTGCRHGRQGGSRGRSFWAACSKAIIPAAVTLTNQIPAPLSWDQDCGLLQTALLLTPASCTPGLNAARKKEGPVHESTLASPGELRPSFPGRRRAMSSPRSPLNMTMKTEFPRGSPSASGNNLIFSSLTGTHCTLP